MSRPRSPGRVYARRYGPAPKPGEVDRRRQVWWVEFRGGEKLIRESSESARKQDANDLLKKRLGELGAGTFKGPEARRIMFEDLAAMLVNDYTANERRSLASAKQSIAHLQRSFGSLRVTDITRDRIDAYIAARLRGRGTPPPTRGKDAPAARATVQKELSALARMFTLAVRARKDVTRPYIPRLKFKNTRASAFTDDELERVLDLFRHGRPDTGPEPAVKAQPELVPPIVFAAITGWRMRSEVLKLEWRQVDLDAGTVSLLINTTKSGEPRVFPFGVVPRLAALLREQREATTAFERTTGTIIPLVFHRRGRQIRNMHMAWKAVCRRAGVPGRVPHDLRRTAARSLRALGMSDRDIAEMCGWETIEMVSRYLGRDPSGVADRLRLRLAESGDRLRTISVRFASGRENG
jgi:integrase